MDLSIFLEKNKKKVYALFLAGIITVISLMLWSFNQNYGILVYGRYEDAGFLDKMRDIEYTGTPSSEAKAQPVNEMFSNVDFSHSNITVEYKRGENKLELRLPHPYAGFKTMPMMNATLTDYNETITTNELGHRSPNLGVKQPGVIRIAMVGGSTAFMGSRNNETIIGLLKNELEDRGYEVEYVNAAGISMISNQEAGVVIHELVDLDIDLLISLDGWNDISNYLYFTSRIGWPSLKWKNVYYNYSEPAYMPTAAQLNLVVENYLRNIEKMAKISRAYEIRYVAVLQPFSKMSEDTCGRDELWIEGRRYSQAKWDAKQYFYCMSMERFRAWNEAEHEEADYLSYASMFSGRPEMHSDEVHIYPWAKKEVARSLAEHIIGEGIINQEDRG